MNGRRWLVLARGSGLARRGASRGPLAATRIRARTGEGGFVRACPRRRRREGFQRAGASLCRRCRCRGREIGVGDGSRGRGGRTCGSGWGHFWQSDGRPAQRAPGPGQPAGLRQDGKADTAVPGEAETEAEWGEPPRCVPSSVPAPRESRERQSAGRVTIDPRAAVGRSSSYLR